MQQDLANPPGKRRNYKNAIDGLVRMIREEGSKSLFRGVWPNTLRAGLMTSSQLATYDEAKALLMKLPFFDDGVATHFSASLISGLVATTICSPVDVIKTRVMSSHDSHGIVHLLTDITKHEGLKWIFRGWTPSFMRLGWVFMLVKTVRYANRMVGRKLSSLSLPWSSTSVFGVGGTTRPAMKWRYEWSMFRSCSYIRRFICRDIYPRMII
jgi:hypothetical protein